ncbi:hypothetical protein N9L68_04440, partial [bacterium]|nr:hypothetical protein [bacterium]
MLYSSAAAYSNATKTRDHFSTPQRRTPTPPGLAIAFRLRSGILQRSTPAADSDAAQTRDRCSATQQRTPTPCLRPTAATAKRRTPMLTPSGVHQRGQDAVAYPNAAEARDRFPAPSGALHRRQGSIAFQPRSGVLHRSDQAPYSDAAMVRGGFSAPPRRTPTTGHSAGR